MLTISNLRLLRGRTIVLDAFSASLATGQGAWVVGPNGAGKSSLLRAIAGLLTPLAGQIMRPDHLIYLGAAQGHDARLSARDNLCFWSGLQNIPAGNVDAALAKAGLQNLANTPAGHLSAGQQQRLALARLLVRPAQLWLLDEPTSALDAAGQAWLAGLFSQHLVDGGMIICATHAPLDQPVLHTWDLNT